MNKNIIHIPRIGLGTNKYNKPELKETLLYAITELGYRFIDTAPLYDSERFIGEVLKDAFKKGIKREEMFIHTKISDTDKRDVEGALKKSLKQLQLDYVDCYSLHFPVAFKKVNGTYVKDNLPMHVIWPEMERMVDLGLTKHIGLCNTNFQMVNDLLSYCRIKPIANQIEIHPQFQNLKFTNYLRGVGIQPVGYCPIRSANISGDPIPAMVTNKKENDNKKDHQQEQAIPKLLDEEVIVEIAKKYGKSPAQVCLNWSVSLGNVVIPLSTNKGRLKENIESLNFQLSQEDMDKIRSLKNIGRKVNFWHEDTFGLDFPIYE